MNLHTPALWICALSVATGCTHQNISSPKRYSSSAPSLIPLQVTGTWNCAKSQANLGDAFRKGYVEVPEDYSNPSGAKIKIFYYGKWTSSSPLVIVNGGPGSSSSSLFKALQPELERRNLEYIFFDQRGTGCSSEAPAVSDDKIGRFAFYGAKSIANDLRSIQIKLKLADQVSIFGHSFGSKVALAFLAQFPRNTKFIAFYGDYEVPSKNELVREALHLAEKNLSFVNLRLNKNIIFARSLKKLRASLIPSVCFGDEEGKIQICGEEILGALAGAYNPDSAEFMEKAITDLAARETVSSDDLKQLLMQDAWWRVNPRKLALYHLDYMILMDGHDSCDVLPLKISKEDEFYFWKRGYCALSAIREKFLLQLPYSSDLVDSHFLGRALRSKLGFRILEFTSSEDTKNFITTSRSDPRWQQIDLGPASHEGYIKSSIFWKTLTGAIQD